MSEYDLVYNCNDREALAYLDYVNERYPRLKITPKRSSVKVSKGEAVLYDNSSKKMLIKLNPKDLKYIENSSL